MTGFDTLPIVVANIAIPPFSYFRNSSTFRSRSSSSASSVRGQAIFSRMKPAPAAPKPQPKKAAHPKPAEPKPSRDEMTFAQRMVTSKEPTGENEIPGMAPAQKIIIVLALIAFIVFMVYTITGSMGLY